MIDVPGMTVPYSTQELESQPLFLNIFEERTSADSIVQRTIQELPDQVTICVCLENSLVAKSIRDVNEGITFPYSRRIACTYFPRSN